MSENYKQILLITVFLGISLIACGNPNPAAEGLTPVPTFAQSGKATLLPVLQIEAQSQSMTAQDEAALGAPIYLQHCSTCHGLFGEGADGPALRNNAFINPDNTQEITDTIANGRADTNMPAWLQNRGGPLLLNEIDTVVTYLLTLQEVTPLPTPTPKPPEPTEAPPPPNAPTPEPALPSNPGGPGAAINITGDSNTGEGEFGMFCAVCHGPQGREEVGLPNPGSEDGIVPELNPIDPTIHNQDAKPFAANVDLFIEHGSVPSGSNPWLIMPAFGDSKMLTDQQIADIIAYVLLLNGVK
jgi:mono/diheme cytochrome c family protein